MTALANYFASKILGTEIPKGFRPYKTFAEELAHNTIDPVAEQFREGKRISQLPTPEMTKEVAKKVGAVTTEVAKVPFRIAMSVADSARINYKSFKGEGVQPLPNIMGIESVQRTVYDKVAKGMSQEQAIAEAMAQVGTDFLGASAVAKLKLPMKEPVKKATPKPTQKPTPVKKEPAFIPHPSVDGEGIVNDTLRTTYEMQKKGLIQ